jgi:hypothetical protein
LAQADCPLLLRSRLTVHSVWPLDTFGAAAEAPEICRPPTMVGPNRYATFAPYVVPSSQAT